MDSISSGRRRSQGVTTYSCRKKLCFSSTYVQQRAPPSAVFGGCLPLVPSGGAGDRAGRRRLAVAAGSQPVALQPVQLFGIGVPLGRHAAHSQLQRSTERRDLAPHMHQGPHLSPRRVTLVAWSPTDSYQRPSEEIPVRSSSSILLASTIKLQDIAHLQVHTQRTLLGRNKICHEKLSQNVLFVSKTNMNPYLLEIS